MTFKSQTQPHCRMCGKKIAKECRIVYLDNLGERNWPDTPYSRHVKANAGSLAECQRLSNWHVFGLRYNQSTRRVYKFSEWDGESYVDPYFCNGSCSRQFAYYMARLFPQLRTSQAQAQREAAE